MGVSHPPRSCRCMKSTPRGGVSGCALVPHPRALGALGAGGSGEGAGELGVPPRRRRYAPERESGGEGSPMGRARGRGAEAPYPTALACHLGKLGAQCLRRHAWWVRGPCRSALRRLVPSMVGRCAGPGWQGAHTERSRCPTMTAHQDRRGNLFLFTAWLSWRTWEFLRVLGFSLTSRAPRERR